MKTFKLYWLDGTTTDVQGNTIADAFNSQYSSGALGALDYYKEVDEPLVAIDIVNPFIKEIKIDGLKELIKRVNENDLQDEVGKWFDRIEDVVNGDEPRGENFTDYVVEWLNHLDTLDQIKKNLNFSLDLSN